LFVSTSNAMATPTASRTLNSATWLIARLDATAFLQTLNVKLLKTDSTEQTLEQWCTSHRLAATRKLRSNR
jgi:hypothetical protein